MLSGDDARKILEALDKLELPAELRAEEEEDGGRVNKQRRRTFRIRGNRKRSIRLS